LLTTTTGSGRGNKANHEMHHNQYPQTYQITFSLSNYQHFGWMNHPEFISPSASLSQANENLESPHYFHNQVAEQRPQNLKLR
jgi:hypothetical protein